MVLGLCLTLAGCRVDQAREVAVYRDVLDLPDEPVLSADQPLGLRDAMRLANRESERLAAQGEGYLRSVIDRRRTLANFLPTADLAPTLSIRNGGNAGAIGRTGNQIGEFETNADVPVDASLNLFNGFRDVSAYWSDTYRIAQQRSNLLAFQEGLLLDVARSYYQVLRSEATVRVFEGSLRTQEERLREAKGRVSAGLASPLTQAQIAAQLSATRSQLIAAQRDVTQLRASLALLVAAAIEDKELTPDPPAALPDALAPLDDALAAAFAYRSELAATAAAVAASRRDVDVAFGQYYPSVSLDVSYFLYRETAPTERDLTGLLSANLPLFAAGRIRADVRSAWSFFRQAVWWNRRSGGRCRPRCAKATSPPRPATGGWPRPRRSSTPPSSRCNRPRRSTAPASPPTSTASRRRATFCRPSSC